MRKQEISLGERYGFSHGYEQSLQDEMFSYYTLLLKFADHDTKGKVRRVRPSQKHRTPSPPSGPPQPQALDPLK